MFAFCDLFSRKRVHYMSDELILLENLIHEIRGKKVMLDFDLAKLYHVETKALKQAVRRNPERFPDDFMFTLTQEEHNSLKINLRSQIVTSNKSQNDYTRYAPFAFTEQGVAMLSSILKSDIAIATNIAIMRAFVQVREHLLTSSSLSHELNELRAKVDLLQLQQDNDLESFNNFSEDIRADLENLYYAIGQLATKIEEKKNAPIKRIGFDVQ